MLTDLIITELPPFNAAKLQKVQASHSSPECLTGDETVLVLTALSDYVEGRAAVSPRHGVAQRLYGVAAQLRTRAESRSASLSERP